MSRTTLRTFLAVFAVAIVAAVPAIASAHKGSHSHDAQAPQTVGTIVSYTDGTLVVSSGGLPVSGKVTPRTRIKFADNGRHHGWFRHHRRHGHGFFGHGAHFGHGRGHGDWTAGGMPTDGGMPSGGGMPTDGGMPTGGGLPTFGGLPRATTDDLKPGTALTKAALLLTPDGPVWVELKLVRPVTPAT